MEETAQLIARSQAGDKEAREILVENNLGLVHHIVKRFLGRGIEAEDLFQIGSIGLIKAIDKFDLQFDVKFSTYAVPVIIGEIKRFLRDDGIIHISRNMKENCYKIKSVTERYEKEFHITPTLLQLEKETGLSQEEILLAKEADKAHNDLGHVEISSEDEQDHFQSMVSGKAPGETENQIVDRVAVSQMLSSLPKKEQQLLYLRYFEGKTQSEVASILSMNQVAVSRLEKKVLLQLRKDFGYNKDKYLWR